jgi:hypothetical protein
MAGSPNKVIDVAESKCCGALSAKLSAKLRFACCRRYHARKGLPIMSYFDVANSALKVAQCSDAACTGPARISVLDDSGSVGTRRTMLIDSNGLPRIDYQDLSASRVKIVQCATRSCP